MEKTCKIKFDFEGTLFEATESRTASSPIFYFVSELTPSYPRFTDLYQLDAKTGRYSYGPGSNIKIAHAIAEKIREAEENLRFHLPA